MNRYFEASGLMNSTHIPKFPSSIVSEYYSPFSCVLITVLRFSVSCMLSMMQWYDHGELAILLSEWWKVFLESSTDSSKGRTLMILHANSDPSIPYPATHMLISCVTGLEDCAFFFSNSETLSGVPHKRWIQNVSILPKYSNVINLCGDYYTFSGIYSTAHMIYTVP